MVVIKPSFYSLASVLLSLQAVVTPLFLLNEVVESFTTHNTQLKSNLIVKSDTSSKLAQQTDGSYGEPSSRRIFFSSAIATGLGSGLIPFLPNAEAITGDKKVNAKLRGYGLPAMENVSGLTSLLEVYGKGANRFPLLVQFSYPLSWVVTKPSNDVNGEDGTVQAGDYAKGDTSTFFVNEEAGSVKNIGEQSKLFYEQQIVKAISQKGVNVYQDFKITKFKVSPDNPNYVIADFKYTLLTGAGFEVNRKGVGSITSVGKGVEVLWCAVTEQRYKKMEETLRNIAGSFRVYADGVNFSGDLYQEGKDGRDFLS